MILPTHPWDEIDYEKVFQPLVDLYRRVSKRVEGLKTHPHLQNYIKTLEISGWSFLDSLHDEDPELWQNTEYCVVDKHWTVAYDVLGSLIRDLPSLETLTVIFSPISSKLQDAFYLSRSLERIVLYNCQMDIGLSTIRRTQITTRLKDLKYEYDPRRSIIAPKLLRQLLSRSLSTLTSLTFSMECIVPISTLICRSPSHTIKNLTITDVKITPVDNDKAEALYELLDSCGKLTTLAILGWMDEALPYLGEHTPPGLTNVAGTASLVRVVSSGRPVSSIRFKWCPLDPVLPSSLMFDQPPTVRVRKVSLECSTTLRQDVLPALSAAFPHIHFLTIRFVRGYRGDRSSAISSLWHSISTSLYHLQVYHVSDIAGFSSCSDIDKGFSRENVECPIGRRDEPRERRHPSLREIRLLSRFTWLWFPDAGWTCHEFPEESLYR